jgi:hypothetical protein
MGFIRNLLSWLRGTPADYVLRVTREDVLRVIRREFPTENPDEILAILDQYGTESWHRERDRVHLAVLKLSAGDGKRLRHHFEVGLGDYRDVISLAEYPGYVETGYVGRRQMSPREIRQMKRADWHQYRRWLSGQDGHPK